MSEKKPAVDPEVIEEVEGADSEDELFAEYFNTGSSADSEKLDAAEKWLPGENDWQGKTRIRGHQTRPLAIIRNYFEYFHEIDEIEPFVSGMIDDYEMYQTSVEGRAREEHVDIFVSMFGGAPGDDSAERSFWRTMAGSLGENEDDD